MPITTLDSSTALILIDLQTGIVALPTVHPAADVVARATELASAFRRRAHPVVVVNTAGSPPGRTDGGGHLTNFPAEWTRLVPELNVQAGDILVTKRTWGAFTHTDLEPALRAQGTTQVVIVGIATSFGVESTARQAYELGFNVSLAVDTMTDVNAAAHANSVRNVFPWLGETGSAADVIAALHRA